jgi:hypothetical protein
MQIACSVYVSEAALATDCSAASASILCVEIAIAARTATIITTIRRLIGLLSIDGLSEVTRIVVCVRGAVAL